MQAEAQQLSRLFKSQHLMLSGCPAMRLRCNVYTCMDESVIHLLM